MSDKIEVATRVAVQLDETQEQLHRLRKWAFNPGNDKNHLAIAIRVLFADRDKAWSEASRRIPLRNSSLRAAKSASWLAI